MQYFMTVTFLDSVQKLVKVFLEKSRDHNTNESRIFLNRNQVKQSKLTLTCRSSRGAWQVSSNFFKS